MANNTEDEFIDLVRQRAHLEAEAAGTPLPPVLSAEELRRAEQMLGFGLSPLVRRLYTEVADGGWGPGYSLTPMLESKSEASDDTVIALHQELCTSDPHNPLWKWPAYCVPLCDWGCNIRTCVDCYTEAGRVVAFDPNPMGEGVAMEELFAESHETLTDWLTDWLNDVDLWNEIVESERITITNPFTGKESSVTTPKLRRRED